VGGNTPILYGRTPENKEGLNEPFNDTNDEERRLFLGSVIGYLISQRLKSIYSKEEEIMENKKALEKLINELIEKVITYMEQADIPEYQTIKQEADKYEAIFENRDEAVEIAKDRGYVIEIYNDTRTIRIYPEWLIKDTPPKDPDKFLFWLDYNFGIGGLSSYSQEFVHDLLKCTKLICKVGGAYREAYSLDKIVGEILNSWRQEDRQRLEEYIEDLGY